MSNKSNKWESNKSKWDAIPEILTKGNTFNGLHIKVYAYVLRQTRFRDQKSVNVSNCAIAKYCEVEERSVTRAIAYLVSEDIVGVKEKFLPNKSKPTTDRRLYLKVIA